MGNLLEIVTLLHKKTKRNYIDRMIDEKVKCMKILKQTMLLIIWDENER